MGKEAYKCSICGSSGQSQNKLCPASFNYGALHDLVECKVCKTTYFYPPPTLKQLETFYSAEGYEFNRHSQEHRAREIVRKYFQADIGRFIDIGCGTGYLLSKIQSSTRWGVFGVELSGKACAFARDSLRLKNIANSDLASANYESNFFDIVHVSEVLEHVPDPVAFLKECRRILKPGGLFLLSLPNGESDRQGLIDYWSLNRKPPGHASGHIYFFSPASLEFLMELTGFKITQSESYAFKQGLRSLGLWPKRKGWMTLHEPRGKAEVVNQETISIEPDKHGEFYYKFKYGIRDLFTVKGMHRIGHAFRLALEPFPKR